jgi:uncharacterized protein (DUF58 family)
VFNRRAVTICLEGLYYVFVLAFIVVGATVRDINLLFVLAGMMIGPLLFNWRLVVLAVRRLEVARRLPAQVFAGRPFLVEIHCQNQRRHLGSSMLVVEDSIASEADEGASEDDSKTRVKVMLPFVPARQSRKASYRVTLPRRGKYRFGPLQAVARFPLGLVKATARFKQFERVVVFPGLGRLTPRWIELLDSHYFGRHQVHSRQGPIDGDYYGLREWRPGDSKRWIHWRTTAKLGKLAVRQFERQQNRDMALVLDLWQPDEPTDEDIGRVEFAVSFAATLVDEFARRGGSQLMVASAGSRTGCWSARATATFARQTLERLAVVRASSNNRLAELLARVLTDVPMGTQVVVISTRPATMDSVVDSSVFRDKPRHQRSLEQVIWLDVNDSRVWDVFQLD